MNMFLSFPLILFSFIIMTTTSSFGSENRLGDRLFIEIWNDNSYHTTLFGADASNYVEEDFYLSQLSIMGGLRYELNENLFFDLYLIAELYHDWGSKEWNDVYWNNSLYGGGGGRLSYELTPEEDEEDTLWISDLTIELFTDIMFSADSPFGGKQDIPGSDASENVRIGLTYWSSIDSTSFLHENLSGWAEVYTELVYHSTGFSEKGCDNYYLFSFELLGGIQYRLGQIYLQPYLLFEMIRDLGDKEWNKEYWLNHYSWGPGFRLSIGELLPIENADLYFYCEYLQRDYMSRVDDSSTNDLADNDLRIGIEIYLPFGATENRIHRH